MLTIAIKKLPHGHDLPLPTKHSAEAAGFDLTAAVDADVMLQPMQIQLIPCGFAMQIPAGYEAQVRPRSGLSSKHGITLVNCVGTIDSDYRGEVKVPLINLGSAPHVIRRGDRIAQMLIAPVPAVRLVEVEELDDTHRGERGFGHTGK
jgi:dUTP pyrophosphatase